MRKKDRKIAHFTTTDSGEVRLICENFLDGKEFDCWLRKWDAYLCVQICRDCIFKFTTNSIYHSRYANFVCNIPGHRGTIYRRVKRSRMNNVYKAQALQNFCHLGAKRMKTSQETTDDPAVKSSTIDGNTNQTATRNARKWKMRRESVLVPTSKASQQ